MELSPAAPSVVEILKYFFFLLLTFTKTSHTTIIFICKTHVSSIFRSFFIEFYFRTEVLKITLMYYRFRFAYVCLGWQLRIETMPGALIGSYFKLLYGRLNFHSRIFQMYPLPYSISDM